MLTEFRNDSLQLQFPDKIQVSELANILESYGDKIKTLSLDCFDTLLWRKTTTPIDVFYHLQHTEAFKNLGFNASMRIIAESKARKLNLLQKGIFEVNLKDIYKINFPELSEAQLHALEAAELKAEIEHCYAFLPMVELMRKAIAKNIQIIIVSDTYFSEEQLKTLLNDTIPQDVFSKIHRIFCSSDLGRSKVNGLFKHVLKEINKQPHAVLHIGDNPHADLMAARTQQMHALHFIQQPESIHELSRMQAAAACFIHPHIRHTEALLSPFKSIFASAQGLQDPKPETLIGYASLGPILYTFARFILDDLEQIKSSSKSPKVAFLMRDAYLPFLACEALAGETIGGCVRISRFAATAASFRTADDIDRYLAEVVRSNRFEAMASQLLLPPHVYTPLIEEAKKGWDPAYQFTQLVHQKHIIQMILQNSKAYKERLKKHVIQSVGLEDGDTLVFVDLGYSGTTQTKLEPIFREEMNVNIVGRYLISLNVPHGQNSRRGLLDGSWCDERIMFMLVYYIALIEQLCTCNEASVIDYDEAGNPLFSESNLEKQQHDKLNAIQAECVRFVHDAKNFFKQSNINFHNETLRQTAMAEIGRILFLPTQKEVEYLQSFQFDLNVGTQDVFRVLDKEKGLASLRQNGLLFLYMDRNTTSMRTNAPAEIRSASLEHALTLMAKHRFNLEFGLTDLSHRRENIDVIIIRGEQNIQTTVQALPTHDGYFSICIPIAKGNLQVGLLLGKNYQWVQLDSASIIQMSAFMGEGESRHTQDCSSNLIVDQMEDKGGGLFQCLAKTSLLILSLPHQVGEQDHVFKLVFRPVVAN